MNDNKKVAVSPSTATICSADVLVRNAERTNFKQWHAELKKQIVEMNIATGKQFERYSAPNSWEIYYEAGYTPKSALLEDLGNFDE